MPVDLPDPPVTNDTKDRATFTPEEVILAQRSSWRRSMSGALRRAPVKSAAALPRSGAVPEARVATACPRDGITFYAVDVTLDDGSFRLWKRYSQFARLRAALDRPGGGPDARAAAGQPFPGRALLLAADVGARRRALDAWLAVQLGAARREVGAAGARRREAVAGFLDAAHASHPGRAVPIAALPSAQLRVPAHELRDGTAYYRVDVRAPPHAPVTVWKSYKMFDDLRRRLGALAPAASFPARVNLSGPALLRAPLGAKLQLAAEEGRERRQHVLEAWLAACVRRTAEQPGAAERERLLRLLWRFVDPAMPPSAEPPADRAPSPSPKAVWEGSSLAGSSPSSRFSRHGVQLATA